MILAMTPVMWALITLYFGHKALVTAHEKEIARLEDKIKEKTDALSSKVKEIEDNVWVLKSDQKNEVEKIQESVREININLRRFTDKLEMLLDGKINIDKQISK